MIRLQNVSNSGIGGIEVVVEVLGILPFDDDSRESSLIVEKGLLFEIPTSLGVVGHLSGKEPAL